MSKTEKEICFLPEVPESARLQFLRLQESRDERLKPLERLMTDSRAANLWKKLAAQPLVESNYFQFWPVAFVQAVADGLIPPENEKFLSSEVTAAIEQAGKAARTLRVKLLKLKNMGIDPSVFHLPGVTTEPTITDFVKALGLSASLLRPKAEDPIQESVRFAAALHSNPSAPTAFDVTEALVTHLERANREAAKGHSKRRDNSSFRWLCSRIRACFLTYFGEKLNYTNALTVRILFDMEPLIFGQKEVSRILVGYTKGAAQIAAAIRDAEASNSGFAQRVERAYTKAKMQTLAARGGLTIKTT